MLKRGGLRHGPSRECTPGSASARFGMASGRPEVGLHAHSRNAAHFDRAPEQTPRRLEYPTRQARKVLLIGNLPDAW